jgi:hypothetical protein
MGYTTEGRDNHERIFGKKKIERGRWVQDPQTGKLVPAAEYVPAATALNAPVMVDRFYEGTSIQTLNEKGEKVTVDLGSRQKHRTYMKDHGLTTVDDYNGKGGTWDRAQQKRDAIRSGRATGHDSKARKEALGRALYEKYKP